MSNITPGVWFIDMEAEYDADYETNCMVGGPTGRDIYSGMVCTLVEQKDPEGNKGVEVVEVASVPSIIDAVLIAAAPELLDALRSAITHLEALHERDCYGCNTCNRVLPAFCALVAKAEGETL